MMTIEQFVQRFAEEFEETPVSLFSTETKFRDLDEWSSLIGLSIISMVDDEFNVMLSGQELRSCSTIKDVYNLIIIK